MACFCETGRLPCDSDALTMLVMNGNSRTTVSWTMKVGQGPVDTIWLART